LDVCDDVLKCFPSLDPTEYVDDLTLGQAGPSWFNVDILSSATDYVINKLEKGQDLEVSAAKSVVVACTRKQGEDIASKVSHGKVSYSSDTKVLGTSTTAGARRSGKLLRSRLKGTKIKVARIVKLRRSGVNAGTWARTAGLSGMMCGADTIGVSNTMIDQQRTAIAAAISAPGAGMNKLISLWLDDCAGNTTEPVLWHTRCALLLTPRLAGKTGFQMTCS
jgi:hypothetical protein